MKTSTEHLPASKQAELKAVVEALIPKHVDVEMIILYGSYARGNYVEDKYEQAGIVYDYKSDYDLLIVLTNNGKANNEALTQSIAGRLDSLGLETPVHPIFEGIEFVNSELREGSYFFGDIKREGILLFTTNRYKLEDKRVFSTQDIQDRAKRDYSQFFKSADVFLPLVHITLKNGDLNESAFLLHQSAERFYCAIQLVFTAYKPKTHDLMILRRMAVSFDRRFSEVFSQATVLEAQRFSLLRRAYVDARYSPDYKITVEDLTYLVQRIELLKKLTERICNEKIISFVK